MATVLGGAIGGVVGTAAGELARLAILAATGDTSSKTITVLSAAVGAGVGGAVQEAVLIRRSGPPPKPRAAVGALVGLLAVVALVSGAALGVATLAGKVTGNQTGVERLAEPASGRNGPLRVTVEGFVDTPDFVKVDVRFNNTAAYPMTVLVAGGCQLIGADGRTLSPFGGITGLGPDEVLLGSGTVVTRVITFKGQPPAEPITLDFSRIFPQGPGPRSVKVEGITLTAD